MPLQQVFQYQPWLQIFQCQVFSSITETSPWGLLLLLLFVCCLFVCFLRVHTYNCKISQKDGSWCLNCLPQYRLSHLLYHIPKDRKLRSLSHSCIFPSQYPACTLCLQYLGGYCAKGISRDDLPDEFLVIFLSVWTIFTQRKEWCSVKVACNIIQELEEMKKWLHVEDVAQSHCLSDRPRTLRLILRISLTACDSSYLWSYHLEGEEMKIRWRSVVMVARKFQASMDYMRPV